MLKIKLPFGFKTISLDNLYVFYTGKIRVKADYVFVVGKLINVEGLVFTRSTRGCTIVSYVVTDYNKHTNNIKEINSVLREIMINRIEKKYGDRESVVEHNTILADELPF